MFWVRSKLVSLLQPRLVSEPELDLKLGLLRSRGTATNLRFDTSVLNPLIQHSTRLCFDQLRVQTLSVAVSFSAITIEVTGVYVKLSKRNSAPGDDVRYQSHTDWLENQKKAILSAIDPEMVLSLIDSLSVNLSGEVVDNSKDVDNSKERYQTRDHVQDNVLQDAIPDGAVVSIQDLQQQTYFAVEGVENQYHVIGTVHYSLVGERALFKKVILKLDLHDDKDK